MAAGRGLRMASPMMTDDAEQRHGERENPNHLTAWGTRQIPAVGTADAGFLVILASLLFSTSSNYYYFFLW